MAVFCGRENVVYLCTLIRFQRHHAAVCSKIPCLIPQHTASVHMSPPSILAADIIEHPALNQSSCTAQVGTLETGEMDYEHFRREVQRNSARPAIVNVNVGTTVKGAVDDLDRILAILQESGYSEDRFYIHCDGALFGLMVCVPTESSMQPRMQANRKEGFPCASSMYA